MMSLKNIFLSSFIAVSLLLNINLAQAANTDAKVKWSQRVVMSTAVSGTVTSVNVKIGQHVKKGDVLLRLDTSRFDAALKKSNAVQRNAAYVLAEAKREKDRAEELYDRGVLSDRDLQQGENLYVAEQANKAKADAMLTNAKKDLEDSVIKAPFAAVIVARQVEVGQTVATSLQAVPMLTLAASDAYIASSVLLLSDLNELKAGQAIDVSTGGERYTGKVEALGMEPVDAEKGLYVVDVRFNAGDNIVRAGQHAILHLP